MSNQNLKKQTADSQDKSYRLVAILIALASVVAFFLPLTRLSINGVSWATKNQALFSVIAELSDSRFEMYGILPLLGNPDVALIRICTYVFYALILALVAALVLAVLAIILSKKSALLSKIATYVFTWGVAFYSLALTIMTSYLPINIAFDASTIVLAVIGALTYFFLMYKENGNKSWLGAAQFALSVIVLAMISLAITHNGEIVAKSLNKDTTFKTVLLLCVLGMFAVLAVNTFCVFCEKNAYVNLVTALVEALLVLIVVIVAQVADIDDKNYAVYTLIAAIVAFLQILLSCLLVLKQNKKEARKDLDAFIRDVSKDEYVEVYPYDGGPVEGIYVAEVVEEAPAEAPAEEAPATEAAEENAAPAEEAPATENAETTEESAAPAEETPAPQPFDAFITTLTDEERMQFTDIYILKTVNMPEIPAYQVGGNNKAFFNKVFIYLGQYRDKIPSSLLAKMYDFSLKI